MRRPLVLIVIDGYGISPIQDKNPITMAKKPVLDDLVAHYPNGILDASGVSVGLPWGEVGNSEVGHLNLGAGLVLYQNLPRINISIDNGSFFSNDALLKSIEHVRKNKSKLHLFGITSKGGVHGHIEHLKALLKLAKEQKVKDVFVHAITDGRDSAPQAANEELKELVKTMKKLKTGELASLCGRFYAMDRNNTWDRTKKSYDLLTQGVGEKSRDTFDALKKAYDANLDDEMLEPVALTDRKGAPLATVSDNDAVIFFNFRPDRARQIAKSFVDKDFTQFDRATLPKNLCFVTMTEYEAGMPVSGVVFQSENIKHPFGWLVAQAGLKQLRIAETEKYAHVTYFFNGGSEAIYEGEDRILIQSPKVKTYDMKPEMSAPEVADKLVEQIKKKKYDFCLVNFANPDMVGHTGNMQATITAIETTDTCIGKIVEANRKVGGVTAITADHGNAEGVVDYVTKKTDKEHSTTVVPFIVVDEEQRKDRTPEELAMIKIQFNPIGILADVAPTLLEVIDLEPAEEMTGRSLLHDLL
ncbi:MAG: 2,3-bisphosphoglycerate-independent phosphoglycerate mutase [Candidatus Uhrbacteria bacterium]|nr:2,3-bisphosphoglycerate-independent phosphoglycerate mutase [Candidatus Uhrbacteria bacterium]